MPPELYWNSPAAVVLGLDDGGEYTQLFGSRLLAEQFVALIPLLQAEGDEFALRIKSSILQELAVGLN